MSEREMRIFAGGGVRDSVEGKLDYEGFDSPLVTKRYAQYMDLHRKQADGSVRGSDNWQLGIDQEAYIKSLIRHVEDLKLHWDDFQHAAVDQDIESVLCAILFNTKGMLFEILKRKYVGTYLNASTLSDWGNSPTTATTGITASTRIPFVTGTCVGGSAYQPPYQQPPPYDKPR